MSTSFTRQPRLSRPCGRLRGLAVLATGVPLVTMVAGLPPAAPAAPLVSAAAAMQETTALRPDGDVASFRVRNETSASAALDDPITNRKGVPDNKNITPRGAGSSTVVALPNPKFGQAQPQASRAWFYARTGAATGLRVEVLSGGALRASSVVKPGSPAGWRSAEFTPANAAESKSIRLRFTAVGGASATIKAAYASLAAAGKPARILRPHHDMAGFSVVPGGTAAGAVDDPVVQPGQVTDNDYITSAPQGGSTVVNVDSPDLGDADVGEGRVRVYASTGASASLRVEVLRAGTPLAATSLPPSNSAGWHTIAFPARSQAAIDALQLRFTAMGGDAAVRAAYVDVDWSRPDRSATSAYLTGLQPIKPAAEEPEHPVGPAGTPDESAGLPDPSAPSGRTRFHCVTTPYSMATAPDKIVALNPDSNKLWLGGLLQGRGYADGLGSLRELPIRKRAPLTIYTDLLGPSVSVTVPHPDGASVQQAVSDLVNKAIAANVPVPARASFLQTEQSSSSQALLKLGFSAKYLGASASAKLEMSRNAQESSVLATFVQRMFTVSIVTPATPSAYFSPDFTEADLAAQQAEGRIGPDNPPVVVGSISYGRTLLYSVTAKGSTAELSGALNAAYSGGAASGSVEVSGRQQEILNSARYQVVALGGDEANVFSLIREHKLGDYFVSHSNPATAVPISYQVNNIGDDSAARFTETTNYNLTECQPMANKQKVVGAKVRLAKPRVYMNGSRSSADIYGQLAINNETQWDRSRDAHQKINLHTQTDLDGWRQPDETLSPWQRDLYFNQGANLRIRGSINCKLYFPEFGADPSNQYDWQWSVDGGGYGEIDIDGGSRSCPITLRARVTKVGDIVEYEP